MKFHYTGSFVLMCTGVSCVASVQPPVQPAGSYAEAAPTYQNVGPIRCEGNGGGNQQGVRISADTGAVVISGNCEYTLSDCEIAAKTQAVSVSGNGRLTLERCQIRGIDALVVSGNAEIALKDSLVFGNKQTGDNAQIRDLGGNQFKGQ